MTSRRKLYALGETFGDSCTRIEAGRLICGGGGGGGSSSSSSSQATTTTNQDMRVVGGNQSTNVSATSSTVTVTDAGAIQASFGFAQEVSQDAFDMASASQINTSKTVTEAISQVEKAYSTAKAGEQKIFAGAALAVVGVVAAIALRKG
jgi:hypothetical protein